MAHLLQLTLTLRAIACLCLLVSVTARPEGRGGRVHRQRSRPGTAASLLSTNEFCRQGLFVHSTNPLSSLMLSLLCPPKINCSRWAPPGTARYDIRCMVKQLNFNDARGVEWDRSLVYQFACGTVSSCMSTEAEANSNQLCYLASDALDLAAKYYPVIEAEPSTEVVAINCA
uniref:Elicitin-like protein n=1 Tax=Macrostomum lignano TaxID=282301 RepID=A0A1I8GDH6_9PLAT